jgi:hypothetical protein
LIIYWIEIKKSIIDFEFLSKLNSNSMPEKTKKNTNPKMGFCGI